MGRYSKSLIGVKTAVFVTALGVDYTDDTTFAAFIANAVEGEIGVFNGDGTVRTTALTAGTTFFVAQKKDGEVSKTPVLNFNDIYRKVRATYVAPTRQITAIGYNGTTGDLSYSFTGASNTNPLEFGFTARETTPGNQPFPVQEARVVVTSATADEYAVTAQLVAIFNAQFDYERTEPDRFAYAEILSNGVTTEMTVNPTFSNGSVNFTTSASTTFATGSYIQIRGVMYKIAVGGTGTSFTLDRPYTGVSETIDVATTVNLANTVVFVNGTTALGIKITGSFDETHFLMTLETGLADSPITTLQAWSQGSGSGPIIVEVEKEGRFFNGLGSTVNAAFAEDYGLSTLFARSTGTYDQIFVDLSTSIRPSAGLPLPETRQIQRLLIAAPSSGTSPNTELATIFAV
jgi:hypothetical protein